MITRAAYVVTGLTRAGFLLLLFAGLLPALATQRASAGEFPDDWFFGGADRQAELRNLEGKVAPDLTLSDEWIGEATALEALRGQVVIVDFWATWCGPCVASIPKNVELVKNYGKEGFTFIGVHDANRGWDRAAGMVQEKSINYPVVLDADGSATFKDYSVRGIPMYVAIDRHGKVRAAGLRPDKVEEVVRVLLAEAGPAFAKAAGAEFPVQWYVGGAKRPKRLAKLEGQPAPGLKASEWIGEPVDDTIREGRVTVLRFIAPWSRASREALPEWSKTARDLGRQGVVFIGISDHLGDWASLETLVGDDAAALPIARDADPDGDATLPLGQTTASYGVRVWPTTVVIDRAGRVRAAGLDEKHLRDVIDKLMAEPLTEAPAEPDEDTTP